MPEFSVVITTYNSRKFVIKAIDCVLKQTCTDREVIVVDDGSTDGTEAILEQYGQDIRYIRQKNRGVSAGRNAGILQSEGDWIAFLDSDDEWEADYLATQAEQIRRHPEAVAHVTNCDNLFPDGKVNNHFVAMGFLPFGSEFTLLVERPFRHIVGHTHWFLQSVVVRRRTVVDVGLLDPELSIGEDMDILGRIALSGPVSFRNSVHVHISRGEEDIDNLAAQFPKQGIASRQAFARVYRQFLSRHELSIAERFTTARILGSTLRALGNILVMASRPAEAREAYWQSLAAFPSTRTAVKYLATFLPHRISTLSVHKGRNIAPGI